MIRLRVESFKGRPLSEPLQAAFDESGGTLGRSESNKLCLPDPERHVSRIHAKVMCRDGQFAIADQGSNPVQLNGKPIGHGKTAVLAEGDLVCIGEYVIRVLADAPQAPPRAPSASPAPAPAAPPAPAPEAASADPLGLFGDDAPAAGGGAFDDLFGPAASEAAPVEMPPPAAPAPPPARPAASAAPLPDWFGEPAQAAQSPAPAQASDLFAGLGDEPPRRSAPAAAIPDDFDPFAEPAAPPEERSLGNDLGLSDFGKPKDTYGESADIDSLFALGEGAPGPDPLASSPLGALEAPLAGGSRDDPLVAFGGAAPKQAPPTAPDNVPELKAAFDVPQHARIPDEPLLPEEPPAARPPAREAAAAAEAKPDPLAPKAEAPRADPKPAAPPVRSAPPAAKPAPVQASAAHAPAAPPDELMAALQRGLGVADLPLEGSLTPELMERIGRMMRESTQGTLDLLLARAMTKREVKAEMTMIVSKGNNPLKFSPNLGMALNHLFAPPRKGFMNATDAMRDAYDDLRSHQFGFMAGMRAALEGVLQRFTPGILEHKLTRKSMLDSLLPMNRKAKLWDLYTEHYQEISREAEDDFHTLFGKAFLRAYEEQIDRLEQARERDG